MTSLPEWLPGKWTLTHRTATASGQTTDFPLGAGAVQIATSLEFAQGSSAYEYSGGPVPPGTNEVAVEDDVVRIKLWPTTVPSLPATVAVSPDGIVVEFRQTIWGDKPSDFKAYYKRMS
jgi:hypothetical protein